MHAGNGLRTVARLAQPRSRRTDGVAVRIQLAHSADTALNCFSQFLRRRTVHLLGHQAKRRSAKRSTRDRQSASAVFVLLSPTVGRRTEKLWQAKQKSSAYSARHLLVVPRLSLPIRRSIAARVVRPGQRSHRGRRPTQDFPWVFRARIRGLLQCRGMTAEKESSSK